MAETEQDTRRRLLRPVLIGLGLLTLLLSLLLSCGPGHRSLFDVGDDVELGDTSFSIDGDTTEAMAPGLTVPIDLSMTNAHSHGMLVSDLAVAVEGVSAPGADTGHPCSVADFVLVQPAVDLQATVPAHTTSSFTSLGVAESRWPRVGMVDGLTNQDGCKGALVTLTYSGSGRLQDR